MLFIGYLLMLTYFMFFSDGFSRSEYTEYHYNITLFKEIKRFYTYRELLGMKAFLINTVGNVVCFMPFGFILPIITELGKRWYNTFLLSFLMTFTIETIQLVFKVGSFDVDDMFLNTVGGIAGYNVIDELNHFLAGLIHLRSNGISYGRRQRNASLTQKYFVALH